MKGLLEHNEKWTLNNVHDPSRCEGSYCTIHNRSDHTMREFPQIWRIDRGFIERMCPHGCGHPDPDEVRETFDHGCDGCCAGAYDKQGE